VYEGEVTELSPQETENPLGGYGKVRSCLAIIIFSPFLALPPPSRC
jgi:hypothetical protein